MRDLIVNALGGLSYGKLLGNIASVFILGLGIIAALNQVEIAVTVTNTVLNAVLGTIAGILVVGVGGGLVKPMQARWERYLSTAETESSNIKEQVQGGSGTPQRVSALQTSTTGATAPVTRPIDTQAPGSR